MKYKLLIFFGLLATAIGFKYYLPSIFGVCFFISILVIYFWSKDEAFWLAFFLVLSDGFIGLFGPYEVDLNLLPGLPGIEVAQIYIVLSVVKALQVKAGFRPFFSPILKLMFIYLIFLLVQGYAVGLSPEPNIQFRVFKLILPLMLFYSIPRLLNQASQFKDFFAYLFPLSFFILGAELFTISKGYTIIESLGLRQEAWFQVAVAEGGIYRGVFSPNTLLITYFGAFYFLAIRPKSFMFSYLVAVIVADFISVFLSATRGWISGFTLTLILSVLFALRLTPKQLAISLITGAALVVSIFFVPAIHIQVQNTTNRMMTLQSLAAGDLSAGGSLIRLTERGPKVISGWKESALTGWGFSDYFFKYMDGHVGNQNILLHSGIIGAALMAIFFLFFGVKLAALGLRVPLSYPGRGALLIILFFLLAWFFIHSTSGQHFSFYQFPPSAIIQALFFTMAASLFRDASAWVKTHRRVLRVKGTPLSFIKKPKMKNALAPQRSK
jgi:hypothetical protein